LTCADALACVIACPVDDAACLRSCIDTVSPNDILGVGAFIGCGLTSCGTFADELTPECISTAREGACIAEFASCTEAAIAELRIFALTDGPELLTVRRLVGGAQTLTFSELEPLVCTVAQSSVAVSAVLEASLGTSRQAPATFEMPAGDGSAATVAVVQGVNDPSSLGWVLLSDAVPQLPAEGKGKIRVVNGHSSPLDQATWTPADPAEELIVESLGALDQAGFVEVSAGVGTVRVVRQGGEKTYEMSIAAGEVLTLFVRADTAALLRLDGAVTALSALP
jgi:hypothetical protein